MTILTLLSGHDERADAGHGGPALLGLILLVSKYRPVPDGTGRSSEWPSRREASSPVFARLIVALDNN